MRPLRRDPILLYFSPLFLAVVGLGVLTLVRRGVLDAEAPQAPGLALYHEVWQQVEDRYVVEVDPERLAYAAVQGMVRELDEYSRIYTPSEWHRQEVRDSARYEGLGIVLGRLEERLTVLWVVPRGPAARAGVQVGDRVLEVEGTSVEKWPPDRVGTLLKGPTGTEVALQVVSWRGVEPRSLRVERGFATEETVWGAMLDPDRRLALLRIAAFRHDAAGLENGTLSLFDRSMRQLVAEGLEGLVIDLRGNRGGLLMEAVLIADRFLDDGPIVTTVERGGRVRARHLAGDRGPSFDVPLVVLVDGGSASAAEVLAGALQDHGRALLVGERTFGKGVVQALFQLRSRPGGLKLTTAHYVTPAGRIIERSLALPGGVERRGGLMPDLVVPVPGASHGDYAWVQELRYPPFIRDALRAERKPGGAGPDAQVEAAIALLRGEAQDPELR